MPGKLIRYQHTGQFHFLTFSCYRRLPLLDREVAYACFEQILEKVRRRYSLVVAGDVLMPEHVHLLVGEPAVNSLAVALQVLKQRTSRKLKLKGQTHLWQRRYYDFNVWNHDKTVEKLKYRHRNPVPRGLVTKPEDWAGGASFVLSSPVTEGGAPSFPVLEGWESQIFTIRVRLDSPRLES